MLISDEYRALNAQLHRDAGGYGSKGKAWAVRINLLAYELGGIRTLLDYGCGKGSLKRELDTLNTSGDFHVREYDPAIAGKDSPPEPADLVICTDVLEHVETECIDDVIRDLVRLTRKACLVAVACRAGKRVLANGKPDHLTVEPPAWWRSRFVEIAPFQDFPTLRDREWVGLLRL